MSNVETVDCPWCGHVHTIEELGAVYTGNHTAECEDCEKSFRFHLNIEIQGPDKIED